MADRRRESREDYEERRQMERRKRQVDPYWEEEPGRRKKKKGSAAGSFFSTLVLVLAIGVFVFAAYKLVGYYLQYKAGSDEYNRLNDQFTSVELETEPEEGEVLMDVEELENPDTVQAKIENAASDTVVENGQVRTLPMLHNPINFTDLNAINDEIIGWLRVGALELSYPIAQAADNDFYLHRTFEKQDNFAGCIFLNCDNSRYLSDQNSIVYGHNMKNGSMFGTLKRFREQETYDSNPYFWIFTPEFIYQYRIFSCAEVSAYGDPYVTRFTEEEFTAFLDDLQKHSVVDTGKVTLNSKDRVVTLSTCTGNSETRFICCGKLEQIYIAA